jgi:hypothetical protein
VIRHIVMWTLKEHAEGADKAANAARMKALLDGCRDLVPGMRRFEAVLAQPGLEATCDVPLFSECDDRAALDAYQEHPTHVAARPFIGAVRATRQCFDYEA